MLISIVSVMERYMLYLRSVYANKFTLFGFAYWLLQIPFFAAVARGVISFSEGLPILLVPAILVTVASMCLGATAFGLETMKACADTLSHFDSAGQVDMRFCLKYRLYCGRAGSRLALKIWQEQHGHSKQTAS
jgi:hypothetical protein